MLTRRKLLQTGVAGMAVLALANCARPKSAASTPFDDPGYTYRELSAGDRELVAAVAVPMLAGALPADPAAYGVAMVQVVRGVDVAVNGLSPGQQSEVHQLFGLLEFPLTRGIAAGMWTSWGDAAPGDVEKFLTSWRFSGIALFRSGYQALHQLVMASWYGNSGSWPRIGYPGPPPVA